MLTLSDPQTYIYVSYLEAVETRRRINTYSEFHSYQLSIQGISRLGFPVIRKRHACAVADSRHLFPMGCVDLRKVNFRAARRNFSKFANS